MPEMLRLTNLENPRRRCLCALVVLCAVCTLTIHVATRYCFTRGLPNSTVNTVQKDTSPRLGRQRMTKTAELWLAPLVLEALLDPPASYPRIAPAGPPLPGLVVENSLYNRPPPSL